MVMNQCSKLASDSMKGNYILGGSIDKKNTIYLILASILAGIGLFMNTKSVVLGSMLISPISVPIFRSVIGILSFKSAVVWKNGLFFLALNVIAYLIGITMSLINSYIEYFDTPTLEMESRVSMPKYVGNIIVPILAGLTMSVASYYDDMVVLVGIGLVISFLPPVVNGGLYHGRYIYDKLNSKREDNIIIKKDERKNDTLESNPEDNAIVGDDKNIHQYSLINKGLVSLALGGINMLCVFVTAMIALYFICSCKKCDLL